MVHTKKNRKLTLTQQESIHPIKKSKSNNRNTHQLTPYDVEIETTTAPSSPPLIPTSFPSKVPLKSYHSHTEPEIEEEQTEGRKYSENYTKESEIIEKFLHFNEDENLKNSRLSEEEEEKLGNSSRRGRGRYPKLLWNSSVTQEDLKSLKTWSQRIWDRELPVYNFGTKDSEKEGRRWSKDLESIGL